MFQVRGFYDAQFYEVTIRPGDDSGTIGCVSGSSQIAAMLQRQQGQTFLVTVTGPTLTLDPSDAPSVLAALQELTDVTGTSGDVPQLIPDGVEGADY